MRKSDPLEENMKLEIKLTSLSGVLLDLYEELNFLYDLSSMMTTELGLEAVASLILEKVVALIGAGRGDLLALDVESGELITVASYTADVVLDMGTDKEAGRETSQRIFSKVLEQTPCGRM